MYKLFTIATPDVLALKGAEISGDTVMTSNQPFAFKIYLAISDFA